MILGLFISICLSIFMTIILRLTPLLLGLWILLIAIITSLIVGIISTSWFGFIVFLIYIGGILVIFVYFAAIQPNQCISFSLIIGLTSYITVIIIFINTSKRINLIIMEEIILSSLYRYIRIPLLGFLGIVLFFALVAVVKVSVMIQGPLRPFI